MVGSGRNSPTLSRQSVLPLRYSKRCTRDGHGRSGIPAWLRERVVELSTDNAEGRRPRFYGLASVISFVRRWYEVHDRLPVQFCKIVQVECVQSSFTEF